MRPDLKELIELELAASPAPWRAEDDDGSEAWIFDALNEHVACIYDRASDGSGQPQFDEACLVNKKLIVAMRNKLKPLLKELEEARARNKKGEELLEKLEDSLDRSYPVVDLTDVPLAHEQRSYQHEIRAFLREGKEEG